MDMPVSCRRRAFRARQRARNRRAPCRYPRHDCDRWRFRLPDPNVSQSVQTSPRFPRALDWQTLTAGLGWQVIRLSCRTPQASSRWSLRAAHPMELAHQSVPDWPTQRT